LYLLTAEKELSIFTAPSGKQRLEYAQSYINRVGGYINNPNATSACQYYSYVSGEDYCNILGITFGDRCRDLDIFIAFVVFVAVEFMTGLFSQPKSGVPNFIEPRRLSAIQTIIASKLFRVIPL